MEKAKLEMVVGVFVFVGIVCLAYLSIKLGKLEMISGDVYEVEAQFNSASGLKPGSTIEIAGVEVGRVRGITLNQDRAMVNWRSTKRQALYGHIALSRRGASWREILALSPGGWCDPQAGDTIRDTDRPDLEELVSQLCSWQSELIYLVYLLSLVDLVCLVSRLMVHLVVSFNQKPDGPDKPNRPDEQGRLADFPAS